MKTDIQIANEAKMEPISVIAGKLGMTEDDIEFYGKYKAKVTDELYKKVESNEDGKLILVTAINPTPAGEGKTTTTVGLGQAMGELGKNAIIALREPSLGPCMGIKGGAAGGGYAQVVPMEDINLHFTGDIHAVSIAHNLLSAMLDNHLQQGNTLGIDPRQIVWKRVVDMNDRALRSIVVGLGGKMQGVPREDGFMITVASEVMAILCLASDLEDLKNRLSKIIVAYTYNGDPVTAGDLNAQGAMTALLKDAIKPNLVQTLENTPALMHGGPFANIAHGCNSIRATKLALKLGDIVITEAGFGADLGMQKFLDLKVPHINKTPDAVVVVTTIRALKSHGQAKDFNEKDMEALEKGLPLLSKHLENVKSYGMNYVIALNHFYNDTDDEIKLVMDWAKQNNHEIALCKGFSEGGKGMVDLAHKIVEITEKPSQLKHVYEDSDLPRVKIEKIAKHIYGAKDVDFSDKALKQLETYETLGWNLPVCMAKTPLSISGDSNKVGLVKDFTLEIKEIRPSMGAGFLVALTKGIMVMPGLNKTPRALEMKLDDEGNLID